MAKGKEDKAEVKQTEPAEETKAQKFSRIAGSRVTTILETMKIMGNLNSPNYEYTPAQVDRIVKACREGVDAMERTLKAESRAKKERATFAV